MCSYPDSRFGIGDRREILDLWVERAFCLVLSDHLLKEYQATLANDFFVARFEHNPVS